MLKAVFFDIGNTLVFANREAVLEPLLARGVSPTTEQLHAAERIAKTRLDEGRLNGNSSVDRAYWDNFYSHLLREVGVADEQMKTQLIALARTSSNWNRLAPGTREVLHSLKQRARLGVISNSDGRIALLLEQLGIGDLFESVTDSGSVGHEKPDARIFLAALDSLRVAPADAVYVGDIYSVDYLGATAVGMKAVLMDAAGVYRAAGVPRVESLSELLAKLPLGN